MSTYLFMNNNIVYTHKQHNSFYLFVYFNSLFEISETRPNFDNVGADLTDASDEEFVFI